MIQGHRRLAVRDLSDRGYDLTFEVNWNKSELVKDCKHIKVKVGSGDEAIISRDELFSLLMLISEEGQQDQLLDPYTDKVPVDNYHTIVEIMAKENVKVGDKIVLPITVSVNRQTGQMLIKP